MIEAEHHVEEVANSDCVASFRACCLRLPLEGAADAEAAGSNE